MNDECERRCIIYAINNEGGGTNNNNMRVSWGGGCVGRKVLNVELIHIPNTRDATRRTNARRTTNDDFNIIRLGHTALHCTALHSRAGGESRRGGGHVALVDVRQGRSRRRGMANATMTMTTVKTMTNVVATRRTGPRPPRRPRPRRRRPRRRRPSAIGTTSTRQRQRQRQRHRAVCIAAAAEWAGAAEEE